jgi:LysM repeat protein
MFLDGSLHKIFGSILILGLLLSFGSCDRMITSRHAQVVKDAESKVADGNFPRAITLYESALDGSDKSSDIHYRLAVLYDDKMHDPLNALHHFKRYLLLTPNGPRATEVRNFMKKDELELATNLSGDSVVSRTEAARLKNENLSLRKELDDQKARARGLTPEKPPGDTRDKQTTNNATNSPTGRTYTVKEGDTLASISRKFYKSSAKWKKIQEANRKEIDNPAKLKPGMTLVIP